MKVLLCAIGKQENHYAREFVEWYKNIGVDHICLYDNNVPSGELFESVIGDYIKSGFVEIINYRGRSICQKDAYNDCYRRYGRHYDWLMFLDMDEFLYISQKPFVGKLKKFLEQKRFENCNGIKISWKCMTDSGLIRVENGDYSLYSRFTKPSDRSAAQNRYAKTIVCGGLHDIHWSGSVHHPVIDNVVDVLGRPATPKNKFIVPIWQSAYLLHYQFKTIEEYVTIKMQRLWPDHSDEQSRERLILDYFFEYNTRTPEKEEYAKQLLSRL